MFKQNIFPHDNQLHSHIFDAMVVQQPSSRKPLTEVIEGLVSELEKQPAHELDAEARNVIAKYRGGDVRNKGKQKEKVPLDGLQLVRRTVRAEGLHGAIEEVPFEGKKWKSVNASIDFANNPNSLWVSLGSSTAREKLFFDANSPKMLELKRKVVAQAKGKPISNVLGIINEIINQLTDIQGQSRRNVKRGLDKRLDDFIDHEMRMQGVHTSPKIKMEDLIEKGLLVCRHKGLIAAVLAAFCVEQNILPPGKIHTYRSDS